MLRIMGSLSRSLTVDGLDPALPVLRQVPQLLGAGLRASSHTECSLRAVGCPAPYRNHPKDCGKSEASKAQWPAHLNQDGAPSRHPLKG